MVAFPNFSLKTLSIILLATSLCGCSLLPKQVEFFQKKVRPFPEQSAREKETTKQAADLAARRAEETLVAAVSNQSPVSVISPAADTKALTRAVTVSLGPPNSIYAGAATNLAARVESNASDLDRRVDKFAAKEAPLVGKKIEGSGFFHVGYFTYVGIIFGLVFLAWTALKIYGSINPVVGVGTNVVGRVSSHVLKRSYAEVVEGGERFKEYLDHSELAAEAKHKVMDLFSRAQKENQSRDTQALVKDLTK